MTAFLERDLAPPVVRHLQAQGYRTLQEVPFNGRIADVLGVKGDEVVAVELKLADYRTAHRQALAYQVGCHRTFVGLPLGAALRCLRKHRHPFEESGVGLLAVRVPDGEVTQLLPARHDPNRFLPFLGDALRVLRAP